MKHWDKKQKKIWGFVNVNVNVNVDPYDNDKFPVKHWDKKKKIRGFVKVNENVDQCQIPSETLR